MKTCGETVYFLEKLQKLVKKKKVKKRGKKERGIDTVTLDMISVYTRALTPCVVHDQRLLLGP